MAGLQADDAVLAGLGESERNRGIANEQGYGVEEARAVESKRPASDHSYVTEERTVDPDYPTEEEKATLRRVPDTVAVTTYLMCVFGSSCRSGSESLLQLTLACSPPAPLSSSWSASRTTDRRSCSVSTPSHCEGGTPG